MTANVNALFLGLLCKHVHEWVLCWAAKPNCRPRQQVWLAVCERDRWGLGGRLSKNSQVKS